MKFTGHERDYPSGSTSSPLDYMHARYYIPGAGRFLSVDPARESADPAHPQTWNRYTYGANNPMRYVDLDGRAIKPYETVAVIAGGTAAVLEQLAVATASQGHEMTAGLMRTLERTMRLGDATGTALGSNASGVGLAMAISSDVATASEAFVTMGSIAQGGRAAIGAMPTTVVHFTDDAGAAAIRSSGNLRAGTYVTKPSQVQGMNAAQVEARLEIQPGRGANSFALRVPRSKFEVPANGATTSGQAWQRQLTGPCTLPTTCAENAIVPP